MNEIDLAALFREKGFTLSSCESLTGGLFASKMTSVSGASHFFKGGFVTYMSELKARLIHIPYKDIDEFGVVSEQIANQMAVNTAKETKSDFAISFTGNAGPEAMEGKPVGLVFIGIYHLKQVHVYRYEFKGTRQEIREQCVEEGIKLLFNLLVQQ